MLDKMPAFTNCNTLYAEVNMQVALTQQLIFSMKLAPQFTQMAEGSFGECLEKICLSCLDNEDS